MNYIGRFAPSPTGPLHFGSLLAALSSYLDAKNNHGLWHLRIDDLDKPREVSGSAEAIITALAAHGLQWDGPIVYQSQRSRQYRQALQSLVNQHRCYPCLCSRSRLGSGPYDGLCQQQAPQQPDSPFALRIKSPKAAITFHDKWQGHYEENIAQQHGDFVIWRKDDICAYQLAVVVDDDEIGVTHVIRGNDLIDSTARQLHLYNMLKLKTPVYGHSPLLINEAHQKLSKQNHAPAIDQHCAATNLRHILACLGQLAAPSTCTTPSHILHFAVEHWRPEALPEDNIIWP